MNYLLKYKLVALCMLWCPVLMAQPTFSMSETIQTPQTQSFVRYGNNPVNLNTGMTGVSIPIYTYKDNDFEIPVSLEYASNGLVANRQTGILGLGWHLNTGGVISRTVIGIPDETTSSPNNVMSGYYNYHRFVSVDESINKLISRGRPLHNYGVVEETFVYLADPSNPSSAKYESAPDIFHFNFMGYQGTFQFDVNQKISVYDTNSSRCNFRIKALNFQNKLLSSFEIMTNDGYKYIFGNDQSINQDANREYSIAENKLDRTVISWQLTKIIAPNGRKISLVYRSGDYMSRGIVKNLMPSSDYFSVSTAATGGFNSQYNFKEVSQSPTYLEEILVENVCRIQFNYSPKESERYGTEFNQLEFPALMKLSSVAVHSLSPVTEQILHCDLRYQYSTQNNKVLFFKEADFGGGKIYKMDYVGMRKLAKFPLNNTCAVDHWGFYNGKTSTNYNNFIPSTTTVKDKEVITSNEREANALFSQLGMLAQISYPTGGYTMYEYEGNSYSRRTMDQYRPLSIPDDKVAGGVRVKTISDYTETGECNRREFSYINPDGTSSGILLKMPRYRLDYTMLISNTLYYINRGSAQDMSLYSLEGSHIEYSRIIEKKSDGSITEYKYKNSFDPFMADKSQVDGFDPVYVSDGRINSSNVGMARFLLSKLRSNAHARGVLASLCTSYNGETIYSEEYAYVNSGGKWHADPIYHYYYDCTVSNVKTAGDIFYIDIIDAVDKAQIGSKTTKEYINGKVFTTQKTYTYESNNGRLNCISTTANDGEIFRERIEYPEDIKKPSAIEKMMVDSFLNSMPTRKVHTIQKTRQQEKVVSGQYYKYKKYGKLIKLEEVRKTAFDKLPQWVDFNQDFTDSDFHNDMYDSWGNLTRRTSKDGSVTCYTWGYDNRYPVTIEKDGLKTHYEYKPLVGIISVTDARGFKTYYEYDEEGRLQCVKDDDKNVLSRYNYHYGLKINN